MGTPGLKVKYINLMPQHGAIPHSAEIPAYGENSNPIWDLTEGLFYSSKKPKIMNWKFQLKQKQSYHSFSEKKSPTMFSTT